jgi:hypothetical protein
VGGSVAAHTGRHVRQRACKRSLRSLFGVRYDRSRIVQKILLPHAESVGRVTAVRSTLLQSSLHALREFGLYERWSAQIGTAERDLIVESIAPVWLPVEVAAAHYEACDRMQVDEAEQTLIGASVGARVQSTLLTTAGKLARNMGVTPDVAARCFAPLWARLFQGGSLQIEQVGPKDLQLEFRQSVLPRCAYFRRTLCGNVGSATQLLGSKVAYAKQVSYDAGKDRLLVKVAWV